MTLLVLAHQGNSCEDYNLTLPLVKPLGLKNSPSPGAGNGAGKASEKYQVYTLNNPLECLNFFISIF